LAVGWSQRARADLGAIFAHLAADNRGAAERWIGRIANVAAELAATLGSMLARPAEAKKTLDNLLAAPAVIHATSKLIVVEVAPAGTRRERAAFTELLRPLNARKLSLPGDPARRSLRFKLQLEGDEAL
jgi:hypothetical protein